MMISCTVLRRSGRLQGASADAVEAQFVGGAQNGLQFHFKAAVFADGAEEARRQWFLPEPDRR